MHQRAVLLGRFGQLAGAFAYLVQDAGRQRAVGDFLVAGLANAAAADVGLFGGGERS